jgi:hypothetical protein
VHPGALLADIGHLKEGAVQSRLLARGPEKRLVGARRTTSHHNPIQTLLGDGLLDPLLPFSGAVVQSALGQAYMGQIPDPVHQRLDIYETGNFCPAIANENTYLGFSLHLYMLLISCDDQVSIAHIFARGGFVIRRIAAGLQIQRERLL